MLQAASSPQMQPALNSLRVRQRLFPQYGVGKSKAASGEVGPERCALQLREPSGACKSLLPLKKGYIATHVPEEWEREGGQVLRHCYEQWSLGDTCPAREAERWIEAPSLNLKNILYGLAVWFGCMVWL